MYSMEELCEYFHVMEATIIFYAEELGLTIQFDSEGNKGYSELDFETLQKAFEMRKSNLSMSEIKNNLNIEHHKRSVIRKNSENGSKQILEIFFRIFKMILLPSFIIFSVLILIVLYLGRSYTIKDLLFIYGCSVFMDFLVLSFVGFISKVFTDFSEKNGHWPYFIIGFIRFLVMLVILMSKELYIFVIVDFILLVVCTFIVKLISKQICNKEGVPIILLVFYYILGTICLYELAGLFQILFYILYVK